VSDLFKTLSGGLAKFVYAWLLPSILTVLVLRIFVTPVIPSDRAGPLNPVKEFASEGTAEELVTLTVAAFSLSLLVALGSLQIYRLLEGYTLPRFLRRPLLSRQRRKLAKLDHLSKTNGLLASAFQSDQLLERRMYYPDSFEDVLPTRFGNALKALERYGADRFGLDSQTLWFELNAVAPEGLRSDDQDTRSSVDFFVSLLVHAFGLTVVSLVIAISAPSWQAGSVAIIAAVSIPVLYGRAVENVLDWRYSVHALVNLGRIDVAARMGFHLPATLREERELWWAVCEYINRGGAAAELVQKIETMNRFRQQLTDAQKPPLKGP
jgi:hypothetical protein